jgi:hypothetical protein
VKPEISTFDRHSFWGKVISSAPDIVLQISKGGTVLQFRGEKVNDLSISSDEIIGKT